ncbi:hypothetical protein LWI29_004295 [Acer saccharum]|uniref:Uncharacterized protein n=1 Tax=Acer saccharum TaxID=4024 RepID=A0AA39W8U4_ACESA|nr:hypothetical protein LWI29_004295 [Acer saccharum]
MHLKFQLQTLKKLSSTMTEYLLKKKSIIDALAYTIYIVAEDDKIMYVLNGLGAEYDSFVIHVTSMHDYYTMHEVTSLLLTHEARLEQHSQVINLNVNLATNKKGNGNNQQGSSKGQSQNWNNGGRNGNQNPDSGL